ncbi:MAG: Gldg family protein [Planctomycetota bacterium]
MNSRIALAVLGLSIALFLAINLLARPVLRGVRADLTEQKLYTLSDGTRNILGRLEEPIRLRLFFSKAVAKDVAATPLVAYAERVREMLEEYVAASGGQLELEVIDPEPYSEAEELAVGFGVQGEPVNNEGDRLYLGLVGTNSVDDEEVLPVLDPRRESYLEYEITEMIDRLETSQLAVVGLITSLPLRGGMQPAAQPGQQPQQTPPWPILSLVERRYELRDLAPATLTEIPEDIDLLLLVHPQGLTPEGTYAIDQFCLRGGKVVAFVDPYCFFDPKRQSNDPMAQLEAGTDSGIDPLLLAWGVAMTPSKIVGDSENGLGVRDRDGAQVEIPVVFTVTGDTMSDDDILASGLRECRYFMPGSVRRSDDAPEGVSVEVLASASEAGGGLVDTMTLLGGLDPRAIKDAFLANAPSAPLALRVSGTVRTAFPDGPPSKPDEGESEDGAPEEGSSEEGSSDEASEEGESNDAAEDGHLTTSAAPFNALVFADADMLHDQVWAAPMRDLFGNINYIPQVDNAALLVSALENLSGSNDLISLRSRAAYNRPFTRKDELTRLAQERFRAEEMELEAKLAEAQQRLNDLQKEKDPANAMILSPEQEAEIENLRSEQVATRRRLRQVKRDLRAEIDSLGLRLKLLNILLIPAILATAVASVRLARTGSRSASTGSPRTGGAAS